MKQMYRLLTLIGLLVLVTACGGDSTPTEPAPAAEEAVAPAEVAPSEEAVAAAEEASEAEAGGEEITLRWRTRPDNQAEIDVYQSVSDNIEASLDGVSLEYEPGGSETSSYQDVLKTEIAAGTAPDVFWIPGTDIADFATRGLIMDVRELADATGHSDEDFYPGPMFHLTFNPETGNSGEALWGLPGGRRQLELGHLPGSGCGDPRPG
jgi:multiple sugar transport system substrate-binding protein